MKLNLTFSLVAAALLALPSTVSAQCANTQEPNNTFGTGQFISVNHPVEGAISTSTDLDFYKLTVPGNGVLSLTLANLGADLDLRLYNNAQTLVASSTNTGSIYESILLNVPSGSATYTIRVSGKNGASSSICYKLFPTFHTTSGSDSNEPNETFETARNIGVNNNTIGKITTTTDQDWFKFTTNSPNTNIQIFLSGLVSDFDIVLFNPSGVQVGQSLAAAGRNEVLTFNTTVAGVYTVKIYGFQGATNNLEYVLRVTTNAQTSVARLAALSTGGEKFDNLSTDDGTSLTEVNFYPNPAVAGENVLVKLAAQDGPVDVRILDMNGEQISSQTADVVSGSANVSLSGIKQGLYLLDAGDGNVYKLVVK